VYETQIAVDDEFTSVILGQLLRGNNTFSAASQEFSLTQLQTQD
jgi:hypothetical protein